MAFEWDDVVPDSGRLAAQADRARIALVVEVEERAALLHRLGWPRAYAQRRVVDDHAWETSETGGPFLTKKELTGAVDRAYRRA